MSISTNFFNAIKTDNRVFYGAVAGFILGGVLEGLGNLRIQVANSKLGNKDIKTNAQYKQYCTLAVGLAATFAYRRESTALVAVAALGTAGSFWFTRQISLINSQGEDSRLQKHIDKAVILNYLGMALKWAVPVTVFSWQVIQSFKGR